MASIRTRNEKGQFETIHGRAKTSEFNIWCNMRQRCYDQNHIYFVHYGGRGITVCERWRNNFANFYEDMGKRPKGKSLDRIDNSKGYSPENCRWATHREQALNTRRNRFLTINGITKTLSEWIETSGLKSSTVRQRYYVLKWPIEKSLTNPLGKRG